MAVRPLSNEAWGFASQCFVCEPSNSRGLGIAFFHDDQAGVVFAELKLGAAYSGAPRYLHGGVVLAVLDEAMAWAAIAVAGRFAVVRTSSAAFEHPVRVDRAHRVEARVDAHDGTTVTARAEVTDSDGRQCARAAAGLVVMSASLAGDAIGAMVREDQRFLRPDAGPPPPSDDQRGNPCTGSKSTSTS